MRRLADLVVNALLRWSRWYHPAAIEAREARTKAVKQNSRATRMQAERLLASYARVRVHR